MNMPLSGASVMVTVPMPDSSGEIVEVFTDTMGLYSLIIGDLPVAVEASMKVSRMGYGTQIRTINLEPGGTYPNENFSM